MKLRFEVDQAACFRRGIDCAKSIITIEVDPSKITQEERDLIADRLDGIDVRQFCAVDGEIKRKARRIVAESPDYQGLIEAIRQNEEDIESRDGMLVEVLGNETEKSDK